MSLTLIVHLREPFSSQFEGGMITGGTPLSVFNLNLSSKLRLKMFKFVLNLNSVKDKGTF